MKTLREQKTKPHPEVYNLELKKARGDVWMVAVHAWDIAGAARAGLRTAFITQEEKDYLSATRINYQQLD